MIARRASFLKNQKDLDASDLIFIDESGCHPGIGPLKGWSPRGVPLFGPEQVYARKQHISIIGAVSCTGTIARATVRGGVGSREFTRFIEKKLTPLLRPGQIVFMDNLNAHKSSRVRHLIESAGATVQFLPPYSPDLNPIEAAWSKMKHFIRKTVPTTITQLRNAIYHSWSLIQMSDLQGWYRYCGYQLK